MQHRYRLVGLLFCALVPCAATGADWRQFRGPHGLGTTPEKGLPLHCSSGENIVWRTELPGPGTSSPVVTGDRVFLTCYTGYALDAKAPGNMADLRRHVLCLDRQSGKVLWAKEFAPILPEHKYKGEGSYHGYSASTPTTDGERLYVSNSLYSTWDNQFYPGLKGWLTKLDRQSDGTYALDPDFFVDFHEQAEGARPHEIHLPGGDCTTEIFQ